MSDQGFMGLGNEKTTSFESKKWLGGSIRREVIKALSKAKTIDNYRSITLNFANQTLQDDIFSILAEIETAPKNYSIQLPPVVKNPKGDNIELPGAIEKEITFTISEEDYIIRSGFRKFFLSIAYGELRKSIHAVGDSIGEMAFLEAIKDDAD